MNQFIFLKQNDLRNFEKLEISLNKVLKRGLVRSCCVSSRQFFLINHTLHLGGNNSAKALGTQTAFAKKKINK